MLLRYIVLKSRAFTYRLVLANVGKGFVLVLMLW